jgi:hypothetical protein
MRVKTLFLLIFVLAGCLRISAQSPGSTAGQISSEKLALMKEIYVATKAADMAGESASAMVDQLGDAIPMMLAQAVTESIDIKPAEVDSFQKAMREGGERAKARLKELLPQRVNWGQAVEQVLYPILDKYFTEPELKDLVAFYKSPTGQKSVQVLPKIFSEAMQKSSEIVGPSVTKLITEVIEEEKQRFLKK